MKLETIAWVKNRIKIIDQTRLPQELRYLYLDNLQSLWQAIKTMQVRGAPVLGAASALGVYLGIKDSKAANFKEFKKHLEKVSAYLASSRPTARNLFWALERMRKIVLSNKQESVSCLKHLIFKEAHDIIEQDRAACRRIGQYGSRLIKDKDTILTICNAGILATIDYGTALGLVYRAKEEGKRIKVFACETRPMLQGARLSSWELKRKGIDVTLVCDSMAATLMQQAKIDKVIVGADRIARNGDTANKIGTYNLAVLSYYHKVPFYVAAPASTVDLSLKAGNEILIEERPAGEVREMFFKNPIAGSNIPVFNPAFDVTPQRLIRAIITEEGIISSPYNINIPKKLGQQKNARK